MDIEGVTAPVGGRTHWEVGGPPPAGATEVTAPVPPLPDDKLDLAMSPAQPSASSTAVAEPRTNPPNALEGVRVARRFSLFGSGLS